MPGAAGRVRIRFGLEREIPKIVDELGFVPFDRTGGELSSI